MTAKVIVIYLLPKHSSLLTQVTLGVAIALNIYYIALHLLENLTAQDLAGLDIRRKV